MTQQYYPPRYVDASKMPLYTYVVTYGDDSYVAQSRHSNYKGFISSWADPPASAMPSLTSSMKKKLAELAYRTAFEELPNRKHVWRKSIALEGGLFIIYAIQTDD